VHLIPIIFYDQTAKFYQVKSKYSVNATGKNFLNRWQHYNSNSRGNNWDQEMLQKEDPHWMLNICWNLNIAALSIRIFTIKQLHALKRNFFPVELLHMGINTIHVTVTTHSIETSYSTQNEIHIQHLGEQVVQRIAVNKLPIPHLIPFTHRW